MSTTIYPIAPTLWAYEIHNILLMGCKRGQIGKEDVEGLLRFLNELDVQLLAPVSYESVYHLAEAQGLTVYDAAYLDSGYGKERRSPHWIRSGAMPPEDRASRFSR